MQPLPQTVIGPPYNHITVIQDPPHRSGPDQFAPAQLGPSTHTVAQPGTVREANQLAFAPPQAPNEEGDEDYALAPAVRSLEIRRSAKRRRTVAARLEDDTLIVYLPARMSKAEENEWVEKMRTRLEARDRRQKLNSSGDLERRARDMNNRYFDGKLAWRSIVYVTNQNTRYGSCTIGESTIRLSDTLAKMPGWVRDYVIVHELAHLVVSDHSARFWDLVNRYPLTERARGFLIAKGLES